MLLSTSNHSLRDVQEFWQVSTSSRSLSYLDCIITSNSSDRCLDQAKRGNLPEIQTFVYSTAQYFQRAIFFLTNMYTHIFMHRTKFILISCKLLCMAQIVTFITYFILLIRIFVLDA